MWREMQLTVFLQPSVAWRGEDECGGENAAYSVSAVVGGMERVNVEENAAYGVSAVVGGVERVNVEHTVFLQPSVVWRG